MFEIYYESKSNVGQRAKFLLAPGIPYYNNYKHLTYVSAVPSKITQ